MGTPMTYISGNTGTYQSGTFNKGTIALNLNPTSLGSGNNWYNGVDVTATQYLIYSDTYTTGIASQANSKPTAWTTPDLSDTSLLNLINTLPDRVGLLPFTSLPLALQWLNATNEYFLIKTNFENIVTSGLVLNLDAGWYNSYSGTTTWFDRSGSGNHVTLRNGPTFDSSSQGSIVFDGTDDYAGNDSPTLPTGNVTITICAWINVQTTSNTWQGIVGWGNTSSSRSALLDMNNGRLAFSTWGGVGSEDLISTYNVPKNTWKYVVGSINNKNIKLYADGIKVLDASISSTPNVASTTLRIATTDYPGRLLNTKVASVQIYNKELTDQEILQNYNAQKSRFGMYDIVQSGLTHSYDSANYLSYPRSGTTWFDMTSTGNNGTFVNGPTFNTGATPSIQFDGADDYINATNTKFIGSAPSTFEFWMNPSVVTNSSVGECFLQIGTAITNAMRLYFFRDSKFAVAYYGNDFTFNYTAVANTMYHAVFTENGSGLVQLYINGVLVSSGNLTQPNTQGSTYWIGQYSNGNRFNGKLFSHRAYNRVLSSQEIVQNFEAQRQIYGGTGYVTSGLTLNLDAGNYASYPTTGTKWVDISGNYNNGTLTNGPTWSSDSGGTFSFDGTDDYVINSNFNITPINNELCISLWYRTSNNANEKMLIDLCGITNTSSNRDFFSIRQNWTSNNKISCYFNSTAGFQYVAFPNQVVTNTWNNIVYSKVGNTLNAYLNGVSVATQNVSGNIQTIQRYIIAQDNLFSSNLFSGSIANVMIYNRGLSASEVLQNYNALKGRFGL
jgi:hypothetical protein